ncbi:MAG: glycosyltransferase [Chitinophagales bacterium]|nr:glycosyltransferase [Chitinophagales bacterium]
MHLTLSTLQKIKAKMNIEVIVVDNNSSADTLAYVKPRFPEVIFISSDINLGFSKANNLGVNHANSDNILILNPDTIISEEVIQRALELLKADNDTGAVAVKMLDGQGNFLPESARGFPDLKSSFFKILGFKKWSSYYKTQDSNDKIEVMSGACMFFQKEIYQKLGGLDERYFMYGEDIDISYQLHKNGLHIKYIHDLEIVHFKGRSSVKSNWRYQTAFYNAMKLYWQKNFQWGQHSVLNFFLSLALWGLKFISAMRHGLKQVFFPLADFIGIMAVSSMFTYFWSIWIKNDLGFLPPFFYYLVLPIYTLVAIVSMLFAKFYLNEIDISKLVKASIANLALFLTIYFILPIDFKYSRAVIIILWFISFFVPLVFRWSYSKYRQIPLLFNDARYLESEIVPDNRNETSIAKLLSNYSNYRLLKSQKPAVSFIVDMDNSTNSETIQWIGNSNHKYHVWIYSESGDYLIKSHGKDENGYIIAADENFTFFEWTNMLRKRILDVGLTCLALPLSIFSKQTVSEIFSASKRVLFNGYSWVHFNENAIYRLPDDIVEDYKRNYSLKADVYYFFRYMFIS